MNNHLANRARPIARGGVAISAGYSIMVLAMMGQEESLVFPSTRIGLPPPAGFGVEETFIPVASGQSIHVWRFPAPSDSPSDERPVILYCHGNGGEMAHHAPDALAYRRALGAEIVLFDYRGYGKSTGAPSEQRAYEDARAVYDWMTNHLKIEPRRIILVGRSLGTAVAIELANAVEHRALVLDSPFTTIPDVAATAFPFLPVRAVMRSRFDSLSRIDRCPGPIFMSHGDRDEIIPIELGRRLYEAAPAAKHWHTHVGRGHNDPSDAAYFQIVGEFLSKHAGAR